MDHTVMQQEQAAADCRHKKRSKTHDNTAIGIAWWVTSVFVAYVQTHASVWAAVLVNQSLQQ